MRPRLALGCAGHGLMPRCVAPHSYGRASGPRKREKRANAQKSRRGGRRSRPLAALRSVTRGPRSLQRAQGTARCRYVPSLHTQGERAAEKVAGWSWEGQGVGQDDFLSFSAFIRAGRAWCWQLRQIKSDPEKRLWRQVIHRARLALWQAPGASPGVDGSFA